MVLCFGNKFRHPSGEMDDVPNLIKHWPCAVKTHFPEQHTRPGRMNIFDIVWSKYMSYTYMWNHVKNFPMFPSTFQPPVMGPAPRPKSPAMASCHTALVKVSERLQCSCSMFPSCCNIFCNISELLVSSCISFSYVLLTSFEIHSISASNFSCSTSQSDETLQFLFNGEGNLNPAAKLRLC